MNVYTELDVDDYERVVKCVNEEVTTAPERFHSRDCSIRRLRNVRGPGRHGSKRSAGAFRRDGALRGA